MSGNGNGEARDYAQVVAQKIAAKRYRKNNGLEWDEIAAAVTRLATPGKGAVSDVRRAASKIIMALANLDPPISSMMVAAEYFETKDAERQIMQAATVILASEGSEDEGQVRDAKAAVAFLKRLLPIGHGKRGAGLRIMAGGADEFDILLYYKLLAERNQTQGKRDAIVKKAATAQTNKLLPKPRAREITEGMK